MVSTIRYRARPPSIAAGAAMWRTYPTVDPLPRMREPPARPGTLGAVVVDNLALMPDFLDPIALLGYFGTWALVGLLVVVFVESGVLFPVLPGDSLLFVAGALCGMGSLDMAMLMPLLMLAAFCGDNTNYWIGRLVGKKLVHHTDSRLFRREYLDKTHAFYKKHGGKTVLFARFLPILRTFAPFVAGIGRMDYRLYMTFSALGSIAWIGGLTLAGYFFGNIPVIKNNLTLMVLGIIIVSLLPAIREFIRHRRQRG